MYRYSQTLLIRKCTFKNIDPTFPFLIKNYKNNQVPNFDNQIYYIVKTLNI